MTVRLRAARIADATAIARVHVATWRTTYAGIVPDAYLISMTEARMMRQWQAMLDHERRCEAVLVAESEASQIVGFGSCGPARSRQLHHRGEVYTLYVAPDWQNRGLGRQLLGSLFVELAARKIPDALIWVLSANPARFFYEALGGQPVAERKEAFAGKLLDETAYAWPDLAGWLTRAGLDSRRAGK